MQLVAITGLLHQPKAKLTLALVEELSAQTDRLVLLDNCDVPLTVDGVSRQRLMGGCVCCSLAAALISRLSQLDADYALLPVSALADPAALAALLDSLRSEHLLITIVALIDTLTQMRKPHLAQMLEFYSDAQVYEPFDYSEAVQAVAGAPLSRSATCPTAGASASLDGLERGAATRVMG
ncbi:MAG: hypothetical protein OXE95_08265 [Chloroflexi bacterium]|nr:hypothetical protein [Chloroflexota bacterium]MCY4247552.1 hypothetical protein [Chloroflexota bacterium]